MKTGSITYNGKNSLELGVYTTGSGSFDAAELDVDKYEIPGRNGDLILSNNRYKNIEITYPAFIPKAFMDKVQNVRNWLRSSRVYARLEDTYDTDHYRLGIPTGVQSFSPEHRNDGANFEMTFDCKPQRFLKAGETPETVEPDVQTASGEIASFETDYVVPMTSAEVSLSPAQDLNGYDSPWPGGGGKNKLPVTASTQTGSGVTFTVNADGSVNASGTATANANFVYVSFTPSAGEYILNGNTSGASSSTHRMRFRINGGSWSYYNNVGDSIVITLDGTQTFELHLSVVNGATVSGTLFYPMLRLSSVSDATFSPYSNICPISGHTGAELYVAAEYDAEDKTTYSVTFADQGTVYGGTIDFVSGKLTVDRVTLDAATIIANYNNYNATLNMYSSYIFGANNAIDGAGGTVNSASAICNCMTCDLTWTQMQRAIAHAGKTGVYKNSSWNYTRIYIYIPDSSVTDKASAEAWLTNNNYQLSYLLGTEQTISLTAQSPQTLLGENNVWSEAGEITLTYAEPFTIENPTLFDTRPLFTVTNPAEGDVIMVNSQTITFVDGYTGTVFIDCETMNAYSGAANLNSIIEATDFPVLVPGNNIVTWTGAGECTMTPRWWEL